MVVFFVAYLSKLVADSNEESMYYYITSCVKCGFSHEYRNVLLIHDAKNFL